jgi:hypothetical protein
MKTMQKSTGIRTGLLLTLCLILVSSACQALSPSTGSVLTLDETPLQSPPDSDNGTFLPISTTQEEVLEKHREERERSVSGQYGQTPVDFYPFLESQGTGPSLTGVLGTDPNDPIRQTIDLLQGEELLFSVDAGLPSPALPLQGLWTYDDHWVMEVLYAEEEIWQGRIYQDGQLLNESLDYQEAFGFQLLAGKPFYFFQRENSLGYSYAGEEVELPYDSIPHYLCCSASQLNPIQAENMVAFYAMLGDQWFYVELGNFLQAP